MLSAALVAGCCELSRTHTRSPELFHELVVADGKMPTWQPRSDKVTGLWFNLIQDVKNAFAKTLVLKSEAVRVLIGIDFLKPSSLCRMKRATKPGPMSRPNCFPQTPNKQAEKACVFFPVYVIRSCRRISLTM